MKNPIVVFDLDGTLADTAPDLIATLNVVLAGEGLQPVPLAAAHSLLGAGAKALIERGFSLNDKPLHPQKHDELFNDFIAHYGKNMSANSRLFDGVEVALDKLLEAGWTLAVCTNKMEVHSKILLKEFGIADKFTAICGRDTFAYFKPDPQHLLLTIAAAGGDVHRAIMVGDSRADMDAAYAAKVPSIGLPFGYTDTPIHELRPTVVIEHFDALNEAVRKISETIHRA